ncbi:MAG: DoxX family membrane protein [Bacteroidales bacterium]|nr:DoxX family membrane protein [Bacteroidales bacterium]
MKIVRIISRLVVGLVFIFSGFVKAVDPLGSAYKFMDYFEAFRLSFFDHLSLPLAIILSTLELLIGINLLLGIRMKITSWLLLIFMSYFTLLTFILAIYNPVSDCGCFGDAIILTNWQTFWKNIILFVPVLIIFISRRKYIPFYPDITEWILAAALIIFGISISLYSYRHLPLLDFRPYKTGASIPEGMEIPEGMPIDEYETTLIYEKNGVQEEFTMENYPWKDSTWTWVETRQTLVKKGYEPPIHDFTLTTIEGEDYTENLLYDSDYSLLMVAYDLSKTNIEAIKKANEIALSCAERNCTFYCITSSTNEEIENLRNTLPVEFSIYTGDEITLKTIIRSNPGLLLIRNGIILGKWGFRDFPPPDEFTKDFSQFTINQYRSKLEHLKVLSISAIFFLVLLAFHVLYTRYILKK